MVSVRANTFNDVPASFADVTTPPADVTTPPADATTPPADVTTRIGDVITTAPPPCGTLQTFVPPDFTPGYSSGFSLYNDRDSKLTVRHIANPGDTAVIRFQLDVDETRNVFSNKAGLWFMTFDNGVLDVINGDQCYFIV